ncbi:hypothetical protein BDV30DRAFT_231353 [Aspergillus minisclerotigenes]|uniref:Uncharacterized protein n=1 Tax=Aspergillus minisclerotigenes TaxID=656917 RepID=A0A5N6IPB8_9EURO|nr:hypothetical protein BDV30DRAFT_231353 [Aspergillus minisclerotigenes]
MKSSIAAKVPNGHGSVYKEVRFSPTATPIRRTQSVPNAHAIHHPVALTTKRDASALSASYMEQAQSLLVRQRASFENERLLFAEERLLWEKERELLRLRIAELESLLKSSGHAITSSRASTDSSSKSILTFKYPFDPQPPAGLSEDNYQHCGAQVWEGSSPGSRPTRVFPELEKPDGHGQHSEQGGVLSISGPSLDAALSPRAHAADSAITSVPVPIEKLDSKLDGITLKSSALPPEIVARVMTPPSPSPQDASPASVSEKTLERRNSLKLRLSELGSLERRLTRDAGHTPMVVIDGDADADVEIEQPSPSEGRSKEGESLAPAAPRQPAENSDSYFSDLPEDPALKGPLSLLNDEEHDSGFLKELDQKLLDQAKQALGYSEESKAPQVEVEAASRASQEPELKFKNSTNFGTAFGISNLGGV